MSWWVLIPVAYFAYRYFADQEENERIKEVARIEAELKVKLVTELRDPKLVRQVIEAKLPLREKEDGGYEIAPEAMPVISFTDHMQFHFNGATIDLLHFGPAHTTGDTAVLFREANVVHMGDVFNASYPFIDAGNGASFLSMAPKRFFAGLNLFPFLAMPFFILAG